MTSLPSSRAARTVIERYGNPDPPEVQAERKRRRREEKERRHGKVEDRGPPKEKPE